MFFSRGARERRRIRSSQRLNRFAHRHPRWFMFLVEAFFLGTPTFCAIKLWGQDSYTQKALLLFCWGIPCFLVFVMLVRRYMRTGSIIAIQPTGPRPQLSKKRIGALLSPMILILLLATISFRYHNSTSSASEEGRAYFESFLGGYPLGILPWVIYGILTNSINIPLRGQQEKIDSIIEQKEGQRYQRFLPVGNTSQRRHRKS
jgi:hypothetical protein